MLSFLQTLGAGCLGFCAVAVASISPAAADAIPYPNQGTENPAVYVFTAQNTGNLSAYFYGGGASYAESFGLIVNQTDMGSGVFPDSAAGGPTAVGAKADFGTVQKGDLLTFYINVTDNFGSNYNLYSNPALNPGATQQVYSTAYTGGVAGIPAGTYVGFEDQNPTRVGTSDFNYTDEQFVFTNTATVSNVPLPGSAPMLGAALLGLAAVGYTAKRKKAASTA